MVEKYRTHEICKFDYSEIGEYIDGNHTNNPLRNDELVNLLNSLSKENKQLKSDLKRCKNFLNSDENDYQLALAFIRSKGYSLQDVLDYEKERSLND